MEQLINVVANTPGILGAIGEAPSEDEKRFTSRIKRPLPFGWVWEEEPTITFLSTGLIREELPVVVEVLFSYVPDSDTDGLRASGRDLMADLQTALGQESARGFDPTFNTPLMLELVERSNAIVPLPERRVGVIHIDYLATFERGFKDARGIQPSN